MLLLFAVIARRPAVEEAPSPFDELLLAEKIRALHRAFFIGGFEDHAIAKIEREHLRLPSAQRRNE